MLGSLSSTAGMLMGQSGFTDFIWVCSLTLADEKSFKVTMVAFISVFIKHHWTVP